MTGIHQTIFKTIFIGVVAVIFAGAGLYFSSCNSNVGLGEAVDTEAPTVSIEYPPANAIVRDAFILAGECSDDKNVAKVEIMISGTLVTNSPVTLNEDGTWEVKVNNKGAGSYPLKDGKYIFNAIAYDDVGRKSAVAERAIEIDNTEPVFIIKTPGGIDIKNPTSYGSMFKVSGNIADDHDIKTFDVDVYDEANSKLEVKLHEENISVAGGTEITFAQYNGEDELKARYIGMYGEGTSGDKSFYCTVKIADSAGKYTKPKKNGDGGGWNTEPDTDSEGNVTTKVYLYDEVYTEYMGKNSVYKFTANDFKAILNGSYQVVDAAKASNDGNRAASITSKDLEDLQKKLSDILKDTSSEKQRLTFKLNKDANPHYEFSGYALDKKDNKYTFSENSASKGSKITFTAKMGLDETYIDPKTITVYFFGPYETEVNAEEMQTIYKDPKAYYAAKYEKTDTNKEHILFDGSKEYEGPTKDSFTTTFTMGDILDGKKYILAASGKDQDDLELVESVEYGFEGVASGQPPRIQITKPTASSNAVIALKGDMTISGTATTAVSEITEIRYEISVYDEGNGNNELTKDDKGNSAPIKGTATVTKTTEGCNWNFDITKAKDYSKYEAKDGNNYKYMITVIAKNSLGLEGQADTTLAVDAKKPEINNITVTPIAKNKEGNNPDVVNGRIKVSFSIADSYLAGTTLVLEQEGKTKKETKYEGSRTLIEEYIYTTKDWDDKKDLKFTVTATDKANNSTTKDYTCRIDQSTDDPVVTITGAKDSDSVKSASEIAEGKNLFGVSSRNLSGSVSDDDGIGEAYISVYEGEGVTGKTPLKDHNKKPIQGTLSHMLPEKEGVYTVVIEAKDKRETNPKDDTPTKSITKTYYVAVDSGAPTITDVSPASGQYVSPKNGMNVTATVKDGSGIQNISVITGKEENNDIVWDTANGTVGGTSEKFNKDGAIDTNTTYGTGYKIEDKITPDPNAQGTYAVKYIATDIYGQSSEIQIKYNIDAGAPTFTITKLQGEPVNLSGAIADTDDYAKKLNRSSGFLDVEGTVEDDVAFDGSVYYKLDTTAPNYAPEEVSKWGGRASIKPDPESNKKGTWTLSIPVNSYDSGTKYSLYIAFKDNADQVSDSTKNPSGIVKVIPDGGKPNITKPIITIDGKQVGLTSKNKDKSVVVTATVTDDLSEVASVSLYCDGEDTKISATQKDNNVYEFIVTPAYSKLYASGEHTLEVRATDEVGNENLNSNTITVDTESPEITINSVLTPAVTKKDDNGKDENWFNGVVTVSASLIDETALEDGSCYWYVTKEDGATTISGITGKYSDDTNYTADEDGHIKIPITTSSEKRYKNLKFDLNTTQISGEYDKENPNASKGKYILHIYAKDTAGNDFKKEEPLNIDQSTDVPTFSINGVDELSSADDIISDNNGNISTKNLFNSTQSLRLSASDDDGIGAITYYSYKGKTAEGTPFKDNETVSNSTILLSDYEEGYYTLVVTVTDKNNNDPIPPRKTTKTYYIAVDAGAPTFESVQPSTVNYYSKTNPMTVEGTVKEGNGIPKLTRKDGTTVLVGNDGGFKDEVTPSDTDGTYTAEYTATDIFGQSSTHKITYKVDSASPEFTITHIGGKELEEELKGGNATYNKVYLNKKEVLEVSGTVTDNLSGFGSVAYYALTATAPTDADYKDPTNSTFWKKTAITTKSDKGEWDLSISLKADEYEHGKEYSLYMTFIDDAKNTSKADKNPSGIIKVTPDDVNPTIENLTITTTGTPVGITNDNKNGNVVVMATVEDVDSGVASVSLYCDGENTKISATQKDNNVYEFIVTSAYSKLYASGVHTLEVRATDKVGNEHSASDTISVDTEDPTISINSISPRVTKGNNDYLNGTVTVSATLTDETELSANGCYWYVTKKGDGNKIGGIISEGVVDNIIEISPDNKRYKNLSISLNTTKISGEYTTDGTGNGEYTLYIYAVDKAGNHFEKPEPLNIDQSTDLPALNINDAFDINHVDENGNDDGVKNADGIIAGKNLFNKGKTLNGSASDDDGVKEITYKLYTGETATGTPETTTSTSSTISYSLPSEEGYYTLVVTVADTNGGTGNPILQRTITKTYHIAVDAGAPTITGVTPANGNYFSQASKMTVGGTVTDGNEIKNISVITGIEKEVDGKTTIEWDTTNGTSGGISEKFNKTGAIDTNITYGKTYTIADTITPPADNGNYVVKYKVTDVFGQSSEHEIKYMVDSASPTFTVEIKEEDGTVVTLTGGSETYAKKVFLKESDGSLDVSGVVKDDVSGFDGFAYYALSEFETAPDYEKLNDSSVWKKSAISTSDNKTGTWELSIPVKGYTSGTSYYLYMTFKDGAGNISKPNSGKEKIIEVIPDGVAPKITDFKVTTAGSSDGITSENKDKDVVVTATVTDNDNGSDVKSVALYCDGEKTDFVSSDVKNVSFTIPPAYSKLYEVSGVHTLKVEATDKVGNISTSESISISVDTQAPTVEINTVSPRVTKDDGDYLNGTVTVPVVLRDDTAFIGDEADDTGKCYWYVTKKGATTPIKGITDADNDGKIKIEIKNTDKIYKNLSIKLDTTQISGENATDTTGKGVYELHIYAVDKAGNVATENTTAELNIDQSTDIPTITFNPSDTETDSDGSINKITVMRGIEGNTIQVTVKDDDEIGKVTYKLNDVELTGTAFTRTEGQKKTDVSKTLTLPADISTGKHTLTVEVEDYVAETGRTSKPNTLDLKFVYDNDTPLIEIDSLAEFQKQEVTNKVTASDEAGIVSVVGTLEKIMGSVVETVFGETSPVTAILNETDNKWTAKVTIPEPVDDSATYKWTFTATDQYGRTSKNSVTHKVDINKPVLVDSDDTIADKITFKAGNITLYSHQGKLVQIVNNEKVPVDWFKEGQNSIIISGKLEETNPDHVIMTITGKDASGNDRLDTDGKPVTVNYATAGKNYSISSDYFDGTNTVVLQAFDKAENDSATRQFTLKVDTKAPTLVDEKTKITDANGNPIVNGEMVNKPSLKLSYEAVDKHATLDSFTDVSGLKQILIGAKYGFKEDEALYKKDYVISVDGVGPQTDDGTATPITIPLNGTDNDGTNKLSEGENTLYIRLIDVAGNVYEDALVTFTYDVTPATVSIATPAAGAEVNKTITITGSVSDKIGLPVTPNTPTGQLQIKKENGTWEDALPGSVVSPVTFENNNTSWSCEFDTTAYNATGTNKTVSIRMIIPDNAGNINDADEGRQITINQDSDRPKIVLTNMDITGTKLKQSTTVYGSISDDDSDSNGVVTGLYIIEKKKFETGKYPSATELNGWTKLSVQAGSGSFSHEGDGEGTLEFYFYCIDNENTPFYWEKTNALDRMYIAGMTKVNDKYVYQDETSGISYTADMNAPVVTLEVARGDAPTDYSAGGKVFSKNDDYSKLYIEMTVEEAVEMKKDNDKKFVTPIVKLNSNAISLDRNNITIKTAEAQNEPQTEAVWTKIDDLPADYKPSDGKTYVYRIGPIDLKTVTDTKNSWTLSAEVSDASDQKGVGNMNITMDTTAPQILITSPSPSISDAVMAAITIKGLAQDDASSIKDLRWAIPLRSTETSTYNYTVDNDGLFTSIGISSAWEIKFSSGSTDSPDSLLYYANAALYAVKETVAGSGIYEVPIYFYVEDAVGNKAVQTKNADGKPLVVYVDADGGKPKAWINSPEQNATVSGALTIYGGASDNISVDRVEIQVDVDNDGDYDEDDYDSIANGTLGDEIKALLAGTRTGDWWIPTIGTNSWKVTIDTSLIASDKDIRIHCRAWDNEETPLTRGWTAGEEVIVKIDSDAPAIRDVKLAQFGDGVTPSATSLPVSELEYTSGMYISHVSVAANGTWYLTATVTDNNTVATITTEKVNVQTSTNIVNLPISAENIVNIDTDTDININDKKKIFIPITTTQSGMVYSTLKATDNNNGVASKEIRINIDSTPPSLFKTDNMQSSTADGDLRLKPSNSPNPIGDRGVQNREQVANSNGLFTFGDYIQEAESGLAFLAFYFERSGKIYDPSHLNKNGVATIGASAADKAVYKNANDLPALYLNVTRDAEDSLTMSGVSAENKAFIRKGGLVKIGGSYRLITKVEGDKVSFTPTCSETFKTAEIIFAQIVDHQISESVGADGKVDKNYDDGDEMIESVNHIGSSYIWSASIDSSNIADGPITIGVAAIDNAGNIATGSIKTFVSNNRPRIAKVMLATDLNGDGKFTYAASADKYVPVHDVTGLETSKKNAILTYIEEKLRDGNSFGEFNYYKVMTDTGIAKEEAELDSEAFKVIEGLCVLPEFVGGNGDIQYIMTQSSSRDATYNSTKDKDGATLSTMATKSTLTNLIETHKNNPAEYDNESIISKKGGIVIDELTGTLGEGNKAYLSFTFWDNTAGTVQGKDSQWAHLQVPITYLKNEEVAPKPTINPFYWNSKTDNSVHKVVEKDDKGNIIGVKNLQGHIELGELPQVSGKIVIEGVVYDNVRLESIIVNVDDIVSDAKLTYEKGNWKWTDGNGGAGVISFEGEDEDISQNGHTMKWKLVCDTEKLSTKAGSSFVNVSATDWRENKLTTSGTQETTSTQTETLSTTTINPTTNEAKTAYYKIDVVPYITGVWTKLSEFYRSAPSVYARTALGHYPVSAGETVTIYGYNLGGTMSAKIGTQPLSIDGVTSAERSAMTGIGYDVTIPGTAKSGKLVLTIGGIEASNNNNGNDASGSYEGTDVSHWYNRQPNNVNNNTLTDDVVFDVWEFKPAAEPKNGKAAYVTMKINPVTGMPGFSFANSILYFNMPGHESNQGAGNWSANDGVGAGPYSQLPMGMNYGGFTHNTFAFDNNGYAYGAAISTDTQTATASAYFQFFSREQGQSANNSDQWGGNGMNQNMNYHNQANASRLDSTSVQIKNGDGGWITNIDRIQSPAMTTRVDNGLTYVYIAYYDDAAKQVRLRWGTVGNEPHKIDGRQNGDPYNNGASFDHKELKDYGLSDVVDEKVTGVPMNATNEGGARESNVEDSYVKYSGANNGGIPIQIVAATGISEAKPEYVNPTTYKAGKYVSLSMVGKVAIVSWYDEKSRNLIMAYNIDPTTSKTWTYKQIDTEAGLNVKTAVDGEGGIHFAYYKSTGSDLKYAYLSKYNAPTLEIVTVDSFGAVGAKCTIDVAKVGGNYVPYISYQNNGYLGTQAAAKIAYRKDFTSSTYEGSDSSDYLTGKWEISVVPTNNIPNDDLINVGLTKDADGVIQNSVTGDDSSKSFYNAASAVCDATKVWANGTQNPLLGYGIDDGTIEMAQMK